METVSMLDFRRDAEAIIRKAQQGKRMILTYRGKAVMRLEPIEGKTPREDDPFYAISELADSGGEALSNDEMDEVIYEP